MILKFCADPRKISEFFLYVRMNNYRFVLIIKYRKEMILSHDDNFIWYYLFLLEFLKKKKTIYLLSFEIGIYFKVKCLASIYMRDLV